MNTAFEKKLIFNHVIAAIKKCVIDANVGQHEGPPISLVRLSIHITLLSQSCMSTKKQMQALKRCEI